MLQYDSWNMSQYNGYNNVVGVAVARKISTVHEKSYIDLHYAWKFEKFHKS